MTKVYLKGGSGGALALIVLKLGFGTNDFKLISALVLAICLSLPLFEKKFKTSIILKKGVERP